MAEDDQIPRRGFLKIIGQAAAVGVGASLLKVSNALAAQPNFDDPNLFRGNLGQIPSVEFKEKFQGEISCPVYMFHEVDRKVLENLVFQKRIQGANAVTASDLTRFLLEGMQLPENPFCLTFDDRLLSQWNNALPVLDQYAIAGTFVVMAPGWPGDGVHSYMGNEQIKKVSEKHDIVAHTINHPIPPQSLVDLRNSNNASYWAQLVQGKQLLEQLIGRPIDVFASPQSVYDPQLIQDIKTAGYKAALMTYEQKPYDPLQATSGLMQIKRERRS